MGAESRRLEYSRPATLTLTVLGGSDLRDVTREAIAVAMDSCVDVLFVHNDNSYFVDWKILVSKIIDQNLTKPATA